LTTNQISLQTYFQNLESFKNDREKILYLLRNHFPHGATEEDLQTFMKKPKHCYSGRFTELKQEELIYIKGTRTEMKNGKKRTMEVYFAY